MTRATMFATGKLPPARLSCLHLTLVNLREWKLDGEVLRIAECAVCRSTVNVKP